MHRVFTHKHKAIPIPNSDTPYSLIWIALRAEAMVIPVPAVDNKRYQSATLNDGNSFNFGDISSRATSRPIVWIGRWRPGVAAAFPFRRRRGG